MYFYDLIVPVHYAQDRDVTALEWLRDIVGASDRVVALAESIYANDFGCSLSVMGMHESIVEKNQWVYGEKYLVSSRRRGRFLPFFLLFPVPVSRRVGADFIRTH